MENILSAIFDLLANLSNILFYSGFYIIGWILNIILAPLNLLVNQFVNLNTIMLYINSFWALLATTGNWFLSFTGIDNSIFSFIVDVWVYILTIPMAAYGIKLVIKWYHALKG